jgi:hypothetical protein
MSYKEEIGRAFDNAVKFAESEGEYGITKFNLEAYLHVMKGSIQGICDKLGLVWNDQMMASGVAFHLFELECSRDGSHFRGMKVV